MFFHDRIISIKPSDKVLEIGPGGTPFHRSDVFLELEYDNEEEFQRQRGNVGKLETDKKIVYYDGSKFPFKDKDFDYVICSHVLEHVPDVPFFLSELSRVARKGYLEYPTVYYDHIFNIPEHHNFLMKKNGTIFYMKKENSPMNHFSEIQYLFFTKLNVDPPSIIGEMLTYFVQGYEWEGTLPCKEVNDLSSVCYDRDQIAFSKPVIVPKRFTFKDKVKIKLKLIIDKI